MIPLPGIPSPEENLACWFFFSFCFPFLFFFVSGSSHTSEPTGTRTDKRTDGRMGYTGQGVQRRSCFYIPRTQDLGFDLGVPPTQHGHAKDDSEVRGAWNGSIQEWAGTMGRNGVMRFFSPGTSPTLFFSTGRLRAGWCGRGLNSGWRWHNGK